MPNLRIALLSLVVIGGGALSEPSVASAESNWPTCYHSNWECVAAYMQCCSPGYPVCSGSTFLCETQYMLIDCGGGEMSRCGL